LWEGVSVTDAQSLPPIMGSLKYLSWLVSPTLRFGCVKTYNFVVAACMIMVARKVSSCAFGARPVGHYWCVYCACKLDSTAFRLLFELVVEVQVHSFVWWCTEFACASREGGRPAPATGLLRWRFLNWSKHVGGRKYLASAP
jgi:hypothetical protein